MSYELKLGTMYEVMLVCEQFARTSRTMLMKSLKYENCEFLEVKGLCLKIILPTNGKVKAISVIIPPDCNKRITGGDDPIYETALVGFDDNLLYDEGLLYDDIRRFSTVNEVADEVKRVIRTVA